MHPIFDYQEASWIFDLKTWQLVDAFWSSTMKLIFIVLWWSFQFCCYWSTIFVSDDIFTKGKNKMNLSLISEILKIMRDSAVLFYSPEDL